MSTHEQVARERKAGHLAEVLAQAGCTSEDAYGLSEAAWERATETANAAFAANHNLPSKETKALVIQNLETRERLASLRSSDPFAGLPSAEYPSGRPANEDFTYEDLGRGKTRVTEMATGVTFVKLPPLDYADLP